MRPPDITTATAPIVSRRSAIFVMRATSRTGCHQTKSWDRNRSNRQVNRTHDLVCAVERTEWSRFPGSRNEACTRKCSVGESRGELESSDWPNALRAALADIPLLAEAVADEFSGQCDTRIIVCLRRSPASPGLFKSVGASCE